MNRGVRAGYRSASDVEEHFKNPSVLEQLGGPNAKMVKFTSFKVRDGGTQSQLAKFTLSNGKSYFVKQTPKHADLIKQRDADNRIKTALGAYVDDAPFVFMIRSEQFGPKNGLIVFPSVPGNTLIASKVPQSQRAQVHAKIGSALGKLHVACLLSKGELENFYGGGSDLSQYEMLIHEDFQASNIMLAEDGKIFFVDTDGIESSKQSYRNIQELWELSEEPDLMKAALEGYLSNYDSSHQLQVLNNIKNHLKKVPESAFPTEIPVPVAPAIQPRDKAKVDSPKSPLELKESRKDIQKSIKVAKREGDQEQVERQKEELAKVKAEEERLKQEAAHLAHLENERKRLATNVKRDATDIKHEIKKALIELRGVVQSYKQKPEDASKELRANEIIGKIEGLRSQLEQKFLVLISAGSDTEKFNPQVAKNIGSAQDIKEDLHYTKLQERIEEGFKEAKEGILQAKEEREKQLADEQLRQQQAAQERQHQEQERLAAEKKRLADEEQRLKAERHLMIKPELAQKVAERQKARQEKEEQAQAEQLRAQEEAARQAQLRVQEEARKAQEKERQAQAKALEEARRKQEAEKAAEQKRAAEIAKAEKAAAKRAEEEQKALEAQRALEAERLMAEQRAAEEQKAAEQRKAAEEKKAAQARAAEETAREAERAAEEAREAARKAQLAREEAHKMVERAKEVAQQAREVAEREERQRLAQEQARMAQEQKRLQQEQAALAAEKASAEREKAERERQAQEKQRAEQEQARAAQQRALDAVRSEVNEAPPALTIADIRQAQQKQESTMLKRSKITQSQKMPKVAQSQPAFDELPDAKSRSLNALLLSFGSGKGAIEVQLKNRYQGKRTEKKLKGLMQNFAISHGFVFTNKRDRQISDLATLIAKLQNDAVLNNHEKGVILYGALQSVIDNIQQTESNNQFKSRLKTVCEEFKEGLEALDVAQLDTNTHKMLHGVYLGGGAEQFRKVAADFKDAKLQRRL